MDRADPNWRKAMINLNLAAASLQGTSYALPDLTTKEMGFPFLKKSPLWLSKPGSDTSLQLIADLPNPAKEIILKEARDLVARRAKNTKSYIESEKNERKKRSWTVQGNT